VTVRIADRKLTGNSRVIESLERLAGSPHLGHAYLFLGPEGIGKRQTAIAFAKAIDCHCENAEGTCESCGLVDSMNHPELMVLEDINKPRWLARDFLKELIKIDEAKWKAGYGELIAGLHEKGYLEEPLPDAESDAAVDGFNIVTDKLFGRGSVPSRECYTPKPVSEEIRKSYDRGDLSEQEYLLLKELYEYPLSQVPYRGAIPIAYVTTRKGWKFTRPIQPFLSVKTMLGGKKIVVIDDAHRMTAEAQNCLLKTLEEPPPDSVLILVTSDKQALFETIVSRCQVVNFGRLTTGEISEVAGRLIGSPPEGTGLMSSLSENSPGRLLELSLVNVAGRFGLISGFFSDVAQGGLAAGFKLSRAVMDEGGSHRRKQRQTVTETLEFLQFWVAQVLRVKAGLTDTLGSQDLSKAAGGHARSFDRGALLEASEEIEKTFDLVRWNIDMRLLLDVTLLRVAKILQP
jgi:DNA polymerase-3 subunit delta'